ncbi:Tyrosine-protein kinase [Caenorhabditis elegans]|uniref:Tyrosine-protein kinase n=1 Tax=Caenorhabditis elegans TaxID=6239 RepID=O01325_CAEEL|nr:Tyrosine-protein kinase [Caenorhabditis elegans]CAB03003.2 Tyrosine-protein kinase [Caenorhabditis elegans]|eukprot:NP_492594.2 Tyrosine-protein kinase [Caenorhabditis elegans]
MLSASRGNRRHKDRSEVETAVRGPDLLLKATDETSSDGASTSLSKSVEESAPNKDKSNSSLVKSHHVLKIKLKKITNWSGCSGALLDDEPFYHGYMSREESEKLVRSQGEFLLRKTELTKRGEVVVLSVFWDEGVHHLVVEKANNGLYYLKEFCFENISDLVRYHHQTRASVYKSGIKLFSWVVREEWQLYHEQINLGKKLGNGEFGEVFQGVLSVGIFTNDVEVAVKTMKGSKVTADERITFLREANLMLKLNHKYVVRLYGVATQQEPIMIVMELCSGGCLKSRIEKKDEQLSDVLKRKYCKQIAKGMRYLEKKQVIHRDLAARNVLLDKSDNCKISDFGLSLFGKLHKEQKLMKVPIRWLAPETLLKGIYSSKSDVWSFGVVMFEVFSGEYPYADVKVLKELRRKVAHENLRLKPPSDMPTDDAKVMEMCFEPVDNRATFVQVCNRYKDLTSPLPTWNGIANKLIGIGSAV